MRSSPGRRCAARPAPRLERPDAGFYKIFGHHQRISMKHPPVRKAVFPVAGLGTRFLPATKAMPKEMLPLVDRPLVQNAIDEAREAGIEEFVIVPSRGKGVLEDHFDMHPELNATLAARSKKTELEIVKDTEISSGHLY